MSDNLHKYVLALSAARDRNVVLTIKVNALESELHEYVGAMQGILKVLKGDKIVHSTLIKEVEDAAVCLRDERDLLQRKLNRVRVVTGQILSAHADISKGLLAAESFEVEHEMVVSDLVGLLAEIGEE